MTEDEQGGKDMSHEEWLQAERERQKKGFSYEPKPITSSSGSGTAEQVLGGVGLGAGVVGGALAPHENPVTFAGCRAADIAESLRAELTGDDTQVQVRRSSESTIVTVLQGHDDNPFELLPALAVTLIERDQELTVSVSDLGEDTKRGRISSIGGTVLREGAEALRRGRGRRGPGRILDLASGVADGVEDVVENIQDLNLPKRVWRIIDRVGNAAEDAYLAEEARRLERERQREAALQAWTNCPYCGRAYRRPDEDDLVECPSCGGPRGTKPDFV
jgi:hypothetical protein